jgi:hypothetical protein
MNNERFLYSSIIDQVDYPSVAINTVFVFCGVRPAFLFQPIKMQGSITSNIQQRHIHNAIKNSISLLDRERTIRIKIIHEGLLIYNYRSINNLNLGKFLDDYNINGEKLGMVLGYESPLSDSRSSTMDRAIRVTLYIGNKSYNVYTMVCEGGFVPPSEFVKKVEIMNSIAKSIAGSMSVKYDLIPVCTNRVREGILIKIKDGVKLTGEELGILLNEFNNSGFHITKEMIEVNANVLNELPNRYYIASFFALIISDPTKQLYQLSHKNIKKWEESVFNKGDKFD